MLGDASDKVVDDGSSEGRSHWYSPKQAGINAAQSLFRVLHEREENEKQKEREKDEWRDKSSWFLEKEEAYERLKAKTARDIAIAARQIFESDRHYLVDRHLAAGWDVARALLDAFDEVLGITERRPAM